MKTVTEWFGHDVVTAIMNYHQVSNADFDKASTDNPFHLVTKKATTARPRMGQNRRARNAKTLGTINNSKGFKALVTPTGLIQIQLTRYLPTQISPFSIVT